MAEESKRNQRATISNSEQGELDTILEKLDLAITFAQKTLEEKRNKNEEQDLLQEASSALHEAKKALQRTQFKFEDSYAIQSEAFQVLTNEAEQRARIAEEASDCAQEELSRAHLYAKQSAQELKLYMRQQEAIAQLGLLVLQDCDPLTLMQRIVTVTAQILNARYCKILKWLPSENLLQFQAVVGWEQDLVGKKVPLNPEGETHAGYAISVGEPVIMYDRKKETRFPPSHLHDKHGIISGVAVLIMQEKGVEPFGILEADVDQHREFTVDDINFLQSMANILSLTVRRKRTEDSLKESEKKFLATFEQAAVGIALVDANGKWLRLNQKYCELLGYTHSELMSLTFQDVSYPGDAEVDDALFRTLLNNERDQYHLEKRYVRKGGSPVWVSLNVSAVRTDAGEFQYSVRTAENITAKKHAEQTLKEYQVKLEQSNKDLEQFALLASHDLQIPLRKVKAFSEIVASEKSKLSAENEDALLRMQNSI